MSKRITATVLIVCMILSITACNNGSDYRETVFTGDTKNGVNPDILEPNQSIAPDALVSDPTTESTTESTSTGSYTYELYHKTFTISARIEDYLYTIDGSDYTYFDLDEFMKHYGLEDNSLKYAGKKDFKCDHNCYKDDIIMLEFDSLNMIQHSEISGTGVCRYISIRYPAYHGVSPRGSIRSVAGGPGGIDTSGGVYDINGCLSLKNNPISRYCLTYSEIIVLAVLLDCYKETGYTYDCKDSLEEIFDTASGGDYIELIV